MKSENMIAMQRGFPELYQRLQKGGEVLPDPVVERAESMATAAGSDALVLRTHSGEKIRMNSMYYPENEAEIWAEGQDMRAENIFIFGLGNGVFVRKILKRCRGSSRVLIYEPSPRVFLYAMEHFDLRFCFQTPGVRLVVEGINEDMFGNVMEEMLTLENYEDYSFILCPSMERVFPESRRRLVERYADDGIGWITSMRNNARDVIDISPYNQLHNLQFLAESTVVPRLAAVWEREVPIVICGAGPSLEEEISVLRDERDSFFLFAVNAALPFLLSQDVVPDVYASVEADQEMHYFADRRAREIPLITKLDGTHRLKDIHYGKKIFGYESGFAERIYRNYGVPQSRYRYGANAATSLFAVCRELGAETVILVGQDMVYGEEKQSHVGGRDEGYRENVHYLCENNQGETVQSRLDWRRFILWYENAIPACRFAHVVNTSLRGARIRGAEVMPFSEAVKRYGRPHSDFGDLEAMAERTFARGETFSPASVYDRCERELQEIREMTVGNPRDERRKEYLVYPLLEMYEMADLSDDFAASQREGIGKLTEYVQKCRREWEDK